MSYPRLKERSTFPRGWEKFFKSNWTLVTDILLTLYDSPYEFAPRNEEIFRMLYAIPPEEIRVIVVGQSPYPDNNACGIPFVTRSGEVTKTLINLSKELSREYRYAKVNDINKTVTKWIDEGIFLINMSFSIGIPPPKMRESDKYVLNHDVLWEEFVRKLVKYVGEKKKRKIPIVLLGAVAWGLEDELMASYHVIKAPFPTRDEFVGSGVFAQCDELVDGIAWV